MTNSKQKRGDFMKKKTTLSIFLVLTILGISNFAHANMSGAYQVISADCTHLMRGEAKDHLFAGKLAKINQSESRFEVLGQNPYLDEQFGKVFSYEVGHNRVNCLTDNCYTLYTGHYSQDRSEFKVSRKFAQTPNSELVDVLNVTFLQRGDEVKIFFDDLDKASECILHRVASENNNNI